MYLHLLHFFFLIVVLICFTLAIRALKNYPRRIKDYAEARSVRGVGEKTARKAIKFSAYLKYYFQLTSFTKD
jgi:uncharacterized membrane protein